MQDKAGDDGGDDYEMTLFVCNCPSWHGLARTMQHPLK
jgi:hypothetical protein